MLLKKLNVTFAFPYSFVSIETSIDSPDVLCADLTFEEEFRIHQMVVMKENMIKNFLDILLKLPRYGI
jgi:hypothetical protein